MELIIGKRFLLRGRYSDFTDHLDGQVVTLVTDETDLQGYVEVADSKGCTWYVQAIDLYPYEG